MQDVLVNFCCTDAQNMTPYRIVSHTTANLAVDLQDAWWKPAQIFSCNKIRFKSPQKRIFHSSLQRNYVENPNFVNTFPALLAAVFVSSRFGCGNNVHISCMIVWADHQKLSDSKDMVKCPLCREDFISLRLLQVQAKNAAKLFTAAEREKPDRHLGVLCHSCRICPITGKCFK